jgi:ethanolamine utilization microcompartment shell protein EutL
MMTRIQRLGAIALMAASLAVAGCTVDRSTGRSTLTGAATGAAAGGVVGLFGGNWLSQVGIGAAAGAASGFVYDQIQKNY